MKILLQQVRITDRSSTHYGMTGDVLIENGRITSIRPEITPGEDVTVVPVPVAGSNACISPGWVDIFSHFCDPGYEHKETLESGARAAANGGYTDVFVIPNTKPVVDSRSQVEYIRHRSAALPVTLRPIGAMTRGLEGKELAEMYDMRQSGAVAFSDGILPVQSAGLLLKGLQYVKAFDGVIIQIPDDRSVGASGLMHEGIVSTRLGLPGKPMMAEELIIARDIKLARYTDSRIHFTGVTSPRSLDYIRRAKDAGLKVTCSVTPYHIFFTDADLINYDTNLKVFPPLRDEETVRNLWTAVLDGTVDCIATHHLPHEYDSKVVEFEYAKPGMTGLETAYGALRHILSELGTDRTVELFSTNARKIFGLPDARIEEGHPAILTIFQPDVASRITDAGTRSKSRNSPLLNRDLKGRVIGIVNEQHFSTNDTRAIQ